MMDVPGRVQNGVIVLEGGVSLPEGAAVTVVMPAKPKLHVSESRKRVEFPRVKSDRPGSVALTNERIAGILDEQDASSCQTR